MPVPYCAVLFLLGFMFGVCYLPGMGHTWYEYFKVKLKWAQIRDVYGKCRTGKKGLKYVTCTVIKGYNTCTLCPSLKYDPPLLSSKQAIKCASENEPEKRGKRKRVRACKITS